MTFITKLLENPETIIAFFALLSGIVSIIYTAKSLIVQREHNYKSVKPIANIELGDYETNIFVRISNDGIGPLIIKDVQIKYGGITSENLIDILPERLKLNVLWNTFASNLKSKAIKVDHQLYLLQKKFPGEDTITPELDKVRQEIRSFLRKIHMKITYTDIYEISEYTIEQDFSWFGRTLDSSAPLSKLD